VKGRTLLIPALAGLGAWAGDARPFNLEATLDLLWRRDLMATAPPSFAAPALRPGQFHHTLSMLGSQGSWTGGVTLRDVNFYQQEPNITLDHSNTSIYKKYIKYEAGRWTLRGGDFNTMLGRGLVLSVIQNPAILKEDTIDGGDARYRGGRLECHGLSGTVSTEKRDQSWRVTAFETTLEWLPGHRAGLRAAAIQDGRTPPFGVPLGLRQCRSASLSGQDPSGTVSYYVESGRVEFRDQQPLPYPSPVDPRKGAGFYGSLSCHRQGWFLMAEAKDYRNFDDALNNPPLADRDTEKNDLYDGSGRRLYLQYSFHQPDLTLFLSAGRYREESSEGQNLFGGFKLQDAFDRLDLACTYGLRTVLYLEKRTDATLTWRFTPLWSLDLTLRDKRNRPTGSDPYEETDLTVQLSRSPRFSVYLLQQRASVPVFDATRLYSAGLRVNLAKGSYLDVSAGRLRGGEVCAGGQCVILPPFEGWKLAAHLRF